MDYYNYKVYENGDIWSNSKKKLLIPYINNNYYRLNLWIDKKSVGKYVHQIVAICYIPNPDNKPEVDHINSKEKTNNNVSNLRWATNSEQIHNQGLRCDNKTGKRGVSRTKDGWLAQFTDKKITKKKHFKSFDKAVAKRKEWELEHFSL